jgi:hypothetical protein
MHIGLSKSCKFSLFVDMLIFYISTYSDVNILKFGSFTDNQNQQYIF